MAANPHPTVQRRRLRHALRHARQARKLTQKEVAEELGWSASKLLRIESGEVRVSGTDLEALLRLYGMDGSGVADEMRAMAKAARKHPWGAYRGVLSPMFLTYLGYEAAASRLLSFTMWLVPGLLQTKDYARAVVRALSAPDVTEEMIDRRVKAKVQRQELLSDDDAPKMLFIIEESVLLRRIGTGEVMAQQLEHLLKVASHPRVDIRVLPLGAGAHRSLLGSFVILEFPDDRDEHLLYLENGHTDAVIREGEQDITEYRETFLDLEKVSIPVEQLTGLMTVIQADMRATGGMASLGGST
jgi:transcriptional regulator with XRE-family HTH domain